jgi:hypothetical protein
MLEPHSIEVVPERAMVDVVVRKRRRGFVKSGGVVSVQQIEQAWCRYLMRMCSIGIPVP